MTATLSTQIHRALFALPLLAVGLAAAFAAGPVPGPHPALPQAAEATLALPAGMLVAKLDCAATLAPVGALGLARMPGDIGPLGRRLRCAQ